MWISGSVVVAVLRGAVLSGILRVLHQQTCRMGVSGALHDSKPCEPQHGFGAPLVCGSQKYSLFLRRRNGFPVPAHQSASADLLAVNLSGSSVPLDRLIRRATDLRTVGVC